jgi:hypothetical protein
MDAAPGVTNIDARAGVGLLDPGDPLAWPPPPQAFSASSAKKIKVKVHIRRTVFTLVSTGFSARVY